MMTRSMMQWGRAVTGLAVACVACSLIAQPAQARVFVGFGFGVPYVGPYYVPPPVYYPPPAYYPPPPVVYTPPPAYTPAPQAGGPQMCYAGQYSCPMDRPTAPGSGCYCLGNGGQRVWGRAS